MDIIKSIEHEQIKSKVPYLKVGDTVKVHVRIKEGNRERIQVFEGIIIKKQGGGVNETFTVRRISYGVGVEKTFLLHAPSVEKVEVVRVGKARRAKLYYLREKLGKAAKTKEKVGARIETQEIQLKEEIEETAQLEDTPVTETVETMDTVKEEPVEVVQEVTPAKETVEEVKEEAKVEETAPVEEAPVEEAKTEEISEEAPVEEEKPAEE